MIPNLDIDTLKTFLAIAQTGSFTRAAEEVNKTQSAVSMQMKRLEERLGKDIFARDGRISRLTDDGERLLDYARRILKLNNEAVAAFQKEELAGRVRLGVPDDYAERYLPEIMAAFAHSNPRVELSVVCEPSPELIERISEGDIDLAIITQGERRSRAPLEVFRQEQLLWVSSQRHFVHGEDPLPLALGRPTCMWRRTAIEKLDAAGRRYRVLYSSWNASAVGAAVMAGLAVSVLPESAVRPGMRVLGIADGFPALGVTNIGLMRSPHESSALTDALAAHVVQALDNLSERTAAE